MTVLRLKITLDTKEDVYREIEISGDSSLLHLHHALLDAFGWDSGEMASFFESDSNWDKGREFSLMDEGGDGDMSLTKISDILKDTSSKAIYVYDFLRMWCFYVEPVSMNEKEAGVEYPRLCLEEGIPPPFSSKDGDLMDGMGQDIDLDEDAGSWNEDHDSLDGLDELM